MTDVQPLHVTERDGQLLWHPYTQHGLGRPVLPVESAHGSYLKLTDGRLILDAVSSWWVNIHGHSHPKIAQAIARQASKLEHVIFAGFTHQPAVRLAEILIGAARERGTSLGKVFYSDNGSTAVEVALKMAYQYHLNKGITGRDRFIALAGSYHGDTLGAMAVGDPTGFHSKFKKLLPQVDFVEPDDIGSLQRLVRESSGRHAGFIFEPMIQGAGGMRVYSAEFLRAAAEICRRDNIILICDEIFTGFYRTGRLFAFEHAGISPDLVCLSKGITGGFLPLAVTLTTQDIFSAFLSDDPKNAFLHGHSYTANPISCAAAIASWDLLMSPECQTRISQISRLVAERIAKLRYHPGVKTTRCLGTIGAVELRGESATFRISMPYGPNAISSFFSRPM